MAVKPQVRPELILDAHPGLAKKSPESICLNDYFSGDYTDNDSCTDLLDATLPADGTHNCPEGELFVYRECGKTACRRQCGVVINANGKMLDAKPFVAPCTGKL